MRMSLTLLKIACPDRVGLLSRLTTFVAYHGGNLLEVHQFTDPLTKWFFARLSIDTATLALDTAAFQKAFAPLGTDLDAEWSIRESDQRMRVGILVSKIDHWYTSQLAYFLEKMENTKDVDGHSLLHNSQIVYGSGNSDGNRHTHVNLPIILAGRAGGALNPGRYTVYNDEPVTNLYLSMMDRVGGQRLDRFGDSTARLEGI